MRLYRVQWFDPTHGCLLRWAETRSKAGVIKNEILSYSPLSSIEIEEIEIPVSKSGLVDWLNSNFHSDNG